MRDSHAEGTFEILEEMPQNGVLPASADEGASGEGRFDVLLVCLRGDRRAHRFFEQAEYEIKDLDREN